MGVGRLWLAALAAFAATSALCALAPNARRLIGLRVVQGLAAGLLVPAGQRLVGRAASPERLGQVMGVLGIAVSLARALGPVVGALVLEVTPWRWLFVINVPIGLGGLLLGLRLVPRGAPDIIQPLDLKGVVLLGTGLLAAVHGLTQIAEGTVPTDPATGAAPRSRSRSRSR